MSKPVDAKAVFQDALELPIAERSAFLDRACGGDASLRARVDALLAADDEAGPFLASPTGAAGDATAAREQPGESIGHFKLQQQIGEGGFGIVWMAEQQEPVRRQVALKIVKRGMDTRSVVARFEQERQALAMMDHQNIAKVFDGGETPAGLPYFVMELVRGVPITQFCDQQHLDPRERLSLFVQVCHAVQHAHQKGIIHRDIKPSNVLVTLHDGVPMPKVIDFGIAKAVHRPLTEKTLFTEFQQMIGTPEYMSPEQAELSGLDIDTRADIYALGVLLYELLTGTLPFDLRTLTEKGLMEMLRTIREDEPQKPSTRVSTLGQGGFAVAKVRRTDTQRLGRLLRGDLDWIVMKALEKDRGRRYVSADAFAADVERYLRDEPVEASPPGRGYRLRKYVRRHRVGVAAASLVVVALVVGMSVAIWGVREANAQAQFATTATATAVAETKRTAAALARAETGEAAAKNEALRANTVLAFVEKAMSSTDPERAKGRDYTVHELLDDFERDLGTRFQSDPEIDASMHRLLGIGFMGLGSYARAEPHLTQALAIREGALGNDPIAVAQSLHDRALLLENRGSYADSLQLLERASVLMKEGPPGTAQLYILRARSRLRLRLARLEQAEQDAQEEIATAKTLFGARPHRETALSVVSLAEAVLWNGRIEESVQLFESALSQMHELPDVNASEVAFIERSFAAALETHGDLERAEDLCRKSLGQVRKTLDDDHPFVASFHSSLGHVLLLRAKLPEAEQELQTALAILRKVFRDDYPGIAQANMTLATILEEQGRLDDAEKLMRDSIDAHVRLVGTVDPGYGLNELASLLTTRGKLGEAEERARMSVEADRATYGEQSYRVARSLNGLALVLDTAGKFDEAVKFSRQSLEMKRRVFGPAHPDVANGLNNLAIILCKLGRYAEAEQFSLEALPMQERFRGAKHPNVAKTMGSLASSLEGQGKFAEAEQYWRKAVALLEEVLGRTHPLLADDYHSLGAVLEYQKKWSEAEQYHRRALEVALDVYGPDHWNVADSQGDLARVLAFQGKFDAAEEYARASLETWRRLPEPVTSRVAVTLRELGRLLLHNGKGDEGLATLRDFVDYQRNHTPAGSKEIGNALLSLGTASVTAKAYAAAETALRECESIEVVAEPGSATLCDAMSLRGYALSHLGRWEEADTLLRDCLEKLQAFEHVSDQKRETLERLIENCEAWGKADDAARWRKVLDDTAKEGGK